MKTLYFEGAGLETAESAVISGVGNCRIRTAFHTDDGSAVYLEMIGFCVTKHTAPRAQHLKVAGWVDECSTIYEGSERPANAIKPQHYPPFEWTLENILRFVNSLGCSFDNVVVLPFLAGYRVFKDKFNYKFADYNYGDEFQYDKAATEKRIAIRDRIEKEDKESGIKFPCFSLWVDSEDPAILHYQNHRHNDGKETIIRI